MIIVRRKSPSRKFNRIAGVYSFINESDIDLMPFTAISIVFTRRIFSRVISKTIVGTVTRERRRRRDRNRDGEERERDNS